MSELLIAIIDDDRDLLYYLENEIESIIAKNNLPAKIVCTTVKPLEFLSVVEEGKINVCFIDINLKSDVNGMYLAERIRSSSSHVEIIFITGHLQYMKNAFQVRAFDYIEKPATTEVLEKCLLRLHKELASCSYANKETVGIKSGPYIYYVSINDIMYIEHNGFKTIVHCKSRNIETYETLKNIVDRLPAVKFKQCHRSICVNTEYVDRISSKEIYLTNGEICILSEKFRKEFISNAE